MSTRPSNVRRIATVWLITGVLVAAAALVVINRPAPELTSNAETACGPPTKELDLHAVQLDDYKGETRLGFGRTPRSASVPGPLITLREGDCVEITLINHIKQSVLDELWHDYGNRGAAPGVSLHPHGVKYTPESDGTLHTGSYVPAWDGKGAFPKRTYTWFAQRQQDGKPGSAGYWWYHDHVVGTDHGSGAADTGLFGGLVVRAPDDPRPDRTIQVAFGDGNTINLKRHPDTEMYEAPKGDVVEFVVFGVGNLFHTFHLHGHSWADNRTGLPASRSDRIIDNKPLGPGDSFGFQIVAGEDVGRGKWMLHCHVQSHSDNGMMTFLRVT